MATIRADLEGVVHVGGRVLSAGDSVPRGLTVGEHLLSAKPSSQKPANTDEK